MAAQLLGDHSAKSLGFWREGSPERRGLLDGNGKTGLSRASLAEVNAAVEVWVLAQEKAAASQGGVAVMAEAAEQKQQDTAAAATLEHEANVSQRDALVPRFEQLIKIKGVGSTAEAARLLGEGLSKNFLCYLRYWRKGGSALKPWRRGSKGVLPSGTLAEINAAVEAWVEAEEVRQGSGGGGEGGVGKGGSSVQ